VSTPAEKLATRIVERLVNEKLILKRDGRRIAAKLLDGSISPEDWSVAVEKASQKHDAT
jgi:hypothetical protein